ncbi:MAG TPA: DUF2442 domain-containing protein [Gemmatimonadaceae bacterium]|nr:DUF2442 domain-containing protein [Gemmatimonadaceae bacterium]
MVHVTSLEYRGGHALQLRFSDGVVGSVDLRDDLAGPIFEPLRDPERFAEAYVDAELGTVVWPNGADVAPEFLYESVLRAQAVAERDTPRA